MNTDIQSARHWPCSNAEYHADTKSISHSALEVFRESPELYYGRYLDGRWPYPRSAAMDLGTVVHTVLLEGKPLDDVASMIPCFALSKDGEKRGKCWTDFKAEHEGEILLKQDEWHAVNFMVQAVREHPRAKAILDMPGEREYSIVWEDKPTGLLLKCRVDIYTAAIIGDLKTSRDVRPKNFASAVANMGYHRQVAMYQDGVEALTGDKLPFVFITVRNSPPYTCEVFDLDESAVELGRQQNRKLLEGLAECRDSGDWHSDTWGDITTLSLPGWARDDANWEISE